MASVKILATPLGLVALDGDKVVDFMAYGDSTEESAKVYGDIQSGKLPKSFKVFLEGLHEKGYSTFYVEDERLLDPIKDLVGDLSISVVQAKAEPLDLATIFVRNGIVSSLEEYERKVKEVCDSMLALSLKAAVSRRDVLIIPVVHAFEDIEKQINIFYMRCREWYGIHFPELSDIVTDIEDYLSIVAKIGSRKRMDFDMLNSIIPGHKKIREILQAKDRSVGGELLEQDEEKIKRYAEEGLRLIELKKELESYLRSLMSIEAPNLTTIAGPILGSKLIAMAGGLEKLAKMPASTIQVIGAEKALFRFFKTGKGAPKHGLIFQHPYVHTSPKWQRGKIARVLASKIAIAARIDYLSKEDRGSELRAALEERIKEIKAKYPEPPKKVKKLKPAKKR